MPINPFSAVWHTVSSQEQPFILHTAAREEEAHVCVHPPPLCACARMCTHTHTHTHRSGGRQGGRAGEEDGSWILGCWSRSSEYAGAINVSWEFNNVFFPLIKIKNKQMQWDSYATEKYNEDLDVQILFTRKKAVNEIWQYPSFLIVSHQLEKKLQVNFNHIALAVIFSVYSQESGIDLSSTFSILRQLIKLLFTSMASSACSFKIFLGTFSFSLTWGNGGQEMVRWVKKEGPPRLGPSGRGKENAHENLTQVECMHRGLHACPESRPPVGRLKTHQNFAWVTKERESGEEKKMILVMADIFTSDMGSLIPQGCTDALLPQWIHGWKPFSNPKTCSNKMTLANLMNEIQTEIQISQAQTRTWKPTLIV